MNNMETITDFDNLYKAYKRSRNNRSYKASAMYFELDAISNLEKIQKALQERKFKVSGYTEFKVTYPKERMIKACKFKDKVVQHVLCDNILCHALNDICIRSNCAGQKGKGNKYGCEQLKKHMEMFLFSNGSAGYFYKGDISRYYYNISHEEAKDIMECHYPQDVHWLIDEFIDSTPGEQEIALGNQINTVVSCLYLDGLDRFITGELGIRYYARYADDFYLIHENKEYLKYCEQCIIEFLKTLKLELNPKSQIQSLKAGISWLGFHYRAKSDTEIEIKLDNAKKRAYRRKFNKLYRKVLGGEVGVNALLTSYNSWKRHAEYCTDHKIFVYYENRLKEMIRLTIDSGFYIAECISNEYPMARQNANTFYLPINIVKELDGTYAYKEYRFNLPINYQMPWEDILTHMTQMCSHCRHEKSETED